MFLLSSHTTDGLQSTCSDIIRSFSTEQTWSRCSSPQHAAHVDSYPLSTNHTGLLTFIFPCAYDTKTGDKRRQTENSPSSVPLRGNKHCAPVVRWWVFITLLNTRDKRISRRREEKEWEHRDRWTWNSSKLQELLQFHIKGSHVLHRDAHFPWGVDGGLGGLNVTHLHT